MLIFAVSREIKSKRLPVTPVEYMMIIIPDTTVVNMDSEIPVFYPENGLHSFAWKEAARWYEISPDMLTYRLYRWYYSIENPENTGAIAEVGFTLDIPFDSVTQQQFNQRYLVHHEVDN